MTDKEFRNELVSRINLSLDLPFIGEETEGVAIAWVVDVTLPMLPDVIKGFILDAADGLTQEELKHHENKLVEELWKRYFDIPWIPKSIEIQLLRPVVRSILANALPGESL